MPRVFVSSAPYSDDGRIGYYINILKSRLKQQQKTLLFSPACRLPGHLMELQPVDVTTATDGEYHAIASLGYVVAALTVGGGIESFPRQAIMEYDVFNPPE